jgi:hypothetical protein
MKARADFFMTLLLWQIATLGNSVTMTCRADSLGSELVSRYATHFMMLPATPP